MTLSDVLRVITEPGFRDLVCPVDDLIGLWDFDKVDVPVHVAYVCFGRSLSGLIRAMPLRIVPLV